MQKQKTQKGITLIALIITIIVILILVGVSVTVALNGGLFSTALKSKIETLIEREKEQLLSAAMGAVGADGKVDFDKLDNNLPEGFTKVGEKTYKSNVTGKTYMVNEYGSITMVEEVVEGPFKLKVELSDSNPLQLLISYEIPELTVENITDEQTISILARAFNIPEEIASYEELYLKVAQGIMPNGDQLKEYSDLLTEIGQPNATPQEVFLILAGEAGFAGVETPQQAAIISLEMGTATLEVQLLINNEDETALLNGNLIEYSIDRRGEHKVSLEVEGLKDEVTIEIPIEDLGLEVKLWNIYPVTLLVSYDMPSYEEILKENEAIKILVQEFNLPEEIETLHDLNLALGMMISDGEITSYEELQEEVFNASGIKNPTDKQIFSVLASVLGYGPVESSQALVEFAGFYEPEVKLIINNEDKTELIMSDFKTGDQSFKYSIPEFGDFEISLEVEGLKDEAKIEVNEQTIIEKWDLNKVNIRREQTTESISIIPIPKDFEVLTTEEKPQGYSLDEGLVIADGENEFVWVPVRYAVEYRENNFGPLKNNDSYSNLAYDSYQNIQYWYGTALGIINNDTSFNTTFSYEADKANIERSIRTYGGFYVGRYETTYDSLSDGVPQGIGVKRGKDVLRADSLLKPRTETKPESNDYYRYRWWGLYKAQKDLYESNPYVGSLMISSTQWQAIMSYTGYSIGQRPANSYEESTNPDKSGSSYSTNSNQYDEAKNIYDLAGNLGEWTLSSNSGLRTFCGSYFKDSYGTASDESYVPPGTYQEGYGEYVGSRITLYIK